MTAWTREKPTEPGFYWYVGPSGEMDMRKVYVGAYGVVETEYFGDDRWWQISDESPGLWARAVPPPLAQAVREPKP